MQASVLAPWARPMGAAHLVLQAAFLRHRAALRLEAAHAASGGRVRRAGEALLAAGLEGAARAAASAPLCALDAAFGTCVTPAQRLPYAPPAQRFGLAPAADATSVGLLAAHPLGLAAAQAARAGAGAFARPLHAATLHLGTVLAAATSGAWWIAKVPLVLLGAICGILWRLGHAATFGYLAPVATAQPRPRPAESAPLALQAWHARLAPAPATLIDACAQAVAAGRWRTFGPTHQPLTDDAARLAAAEALAGAATWADRTPDGGLPPRAQAWADQLAQACAPAWQAGLFADTRLALGIHDFSFAALLTHAAEACTHLAPADGDDVRPRAQVRTLWTWPAGTRPLAGGPALQAPLALHARVVLDAPLDAGAQSPTVGELAAAWRTGQRAQAAGDVLAPAPTWVPLPGALRAAG